MSYPEGVWTAEAMQMVVRAKVAEIRQSLKGIERSLTDAKTIQRVAIRPQEKAV